ncbi:MAG TPA: MFS transporter [Arenicellales bacterium]|nr:MFS transporter [Arenicellales bacterium]
MWLLYMAFGLNMASLAPLVGDIEPDLAISHAAMGVILGAWQFVYIFAAIPCGLLLDRLGSRRGLAMGGLIIALSGVLRGYSEEHLHLLAAVALFGLGGPLISAGAPKVISEYFRGARRGLAMGVYITGPGVGAITALLLTQPVLMPLLDHDWRLLLQSWGMVALVASLFWIGVSRGEPKRREGLPQLRSASADIRAILALPAVRLILLMSIAVFAINHAMGNWLVQILMTFGANAQEASLIAVVPVVIGICSALTLPGLAVGRRRYTVMASLFVCSVLGSVLLLSMPTGPWLYVALGLEGVAAGAMMTVLILTLVEVPGVGEGRAGTAGGFFFSAAEIGGVGGPVALGVLYGGAGNFVSGLALLALLGVFLVGSVIPLRRQLLTPE